MAAGVRRINLALQGGGAHGAFTWGVVDRLLEDDSIEIAGISGTSAGALNGAALKSGLIAGGRDGARANLDWLWTEVAAIQDFRLKQWMFGFFPSAGDVARFWAGLTPYPLVEAMQRAFSPYDLPFLSENPLRSVAERFHYPRIHAEDGPFFSVSATNVRTGKIRAFSGTEITTDVILASACLPTAFRAVELHDPLTGRREAFWDGGYTGNPAIFPLYRKGLPPDVVIVNINPLVRDELPRSAQEIDNRINEISFNAALMGELRSINFVQRLLAQERIPEGHMKQVFVHMIADDDLMNSLSADTKISASPELIIALKAAGRAACDKFMERHGAALNKSGTVEMEKLYG